MRLFSERQFRLNLILHETHHLYSSLSVSPFAKSFYPCWPLNKHLLWEKSLHLWTMTDRNLRLEEQKSRTYWSMISYICWQIIISVGALATQQQQNGSHLCPSQLSRDCKRNKHDLGYRDYLCPSVMKSTYSKREINGK